MLGGAALCAAALLVRARARRARCTAGSTLLALAVLAASPRSRSPGRSRPSDSWLEANRTFAYLAAFAGALALVRLAPRPLGRGARRRRARAA